MSSLPGPSGPGAGHPHGGRRRGTRPARPRRRSVRDRGTSHRGGAAQAARPPRPGRPADPGGGGSRSRPETPLASGPAPQARLVDRDQPDHQAGDLPVDGAPEPDPVSGQSGRLPEPDAQEAPWGSTSGSSRSRASDRSRSRGAPRRRTRSGGRGGHGQEPAPQEPRRAPRDGDDQRAVGPGPPPSRSPEPVTVSTTDGWPAVSYLPVVCGPGRAGQARAGRRPPTAARPAAAVALAGAVPARPPWRGLSQIRGVAGTSIQGSSGSCGFPPFLLSPGRGRVESRRSGRRAGAAVRLSRGLLGFGLGQPFERRSAGAASQG